MENRKFVIIIILFLINFVFVNDVYSYNGETHRAITKETIEFYNESNNKKISDNDKEIIINGSEEEDKPLYRTVNHFYDPVYNKGLLSNFYPAYDWAENTKAQAMYSPQYALLSKLMSLYSSNSDFSFDRAVYEYANVNKERGLETLGHILHLIEDMSVPAHTRDDQHITGDYYETYAGKYDIKTINDISSELMKEKEKSKQFSSLYNYFFNLANYSNNNFYSWDTVLSKKYIEPKIEIEKKDLNSGITFGYKNLGSENFKLVKTKGGISFFTNEKIETYSIKDNNNEVISSYWSHLSKQAVLNASGVISLFFKKVEEEKDTMALYNKNRDSIKKLFGSGLYQTANIGNIQENNEARKQENNETINQISQPTENKKQEPKNENTTQSAVPEQNSSIDEIQTTVTTPTENNQQQNTSNNIVEYNVQEPSPITPEYTPGFGGGGAGGSSPRRNTHPSITLTGNASITITRGDTYTDLGATASDLEDGNITANIVRTGSVDTATVGTYTLRYNVSDSEGLEANEIARTVIVGNEPLPPKPIITVPNTNPYISTTNSIAFSGIASSSLLISNDFSNATTTSDGSENWSMTLSSFGEGTTTINFIASNTNYSTSTATEFSVFVDTQIPVFNSFSITECAHSISTDVNECLVPTTKINPVWDSDAQDISFYEVYLNNVLATTTTATTTEITILENLQSEIKIRAVDTAGNERYSDIKQVKTTINMPVVINEIAWAGTSADLTGDEWIELFNRTSQELKLSDFTIFADDGTPYINLSTTILPNSFYLIERTDDTTVNVLANLVAPFSGSSGSGLGNSGEILSLVYSTGTATTTVDRTPNLEDCGGTWCGGTAGTEYRTMERKNPDISGTIGSNWTSNNTYRKNGTNANGGLINGTPNSRNSANISQSDIGFFCSPYVHTFQEGLSYTPIASTCTFIFPNFRTVATYGDVYKGEVGNSVILNGHSLKTHITTITEKDQVESFMNDLNNGDRIYIAIYETRQASNDVNDFRSYFTTGGTPTPHSNYAILNWIYVE